MNLNDQEKELLRGILDARLVELKSAQNYWTGRTPRDLIDRTLKQQRDTQALRDTIFGKE